ncbi:Cell division protein FtsH [Devosia sp. DBB001]|nr:Cell division protein FtsH [Devosia sp. DBB001]
MVDLALHEALGPVLRKKLASGRGCCIVVKVPEPSWVDPVDDAFAPLTKDKAIVIARAKQPLPRDREESMLANRLEAGRIVIGVSSDREWLPKLLLDTAEDHVEIPAADAALVAKVLRKCARGRVPAEAVSLGTELLTFDQITSMIASGTSATEAVRRMSRAIAARTKVGTREERLPKLEDAIEYGDARRWALDLRDDLTDVRAGKIGYGDVDRGALLFGPPGTGKTLLARMLGQDLGIPVIVSSVGQWFATSGGYLNEVIKAQRSAFNEARSRAPAILFLDEINAMPNVDSLEGSRNADYWKPLILDFYTLLDGAMEGRDGVVVIGATNRIEDINPAILRPGRLERAIFVGPPDAAGVERIMRFHLGGDLVDVDIGHLARLNVAKQATGAVVMEQIRAARRRARRAGRAIALDDVTAQIIDKEDRTQETLRRVAVHEAGHGIASIELGLGTPEYITVLPMGVSGGLTMFKKAEFHLGFREDFERLVTMMLAGRAAEHAVLGRPSQGAGGHPESDLGRSTHLIATMLASTGLGDTLSYVPEADVGQMLRLDREFRIKVEKVITALYDRALRLMSDHRSGLVAIADALMERKYLSTQDISSLLKGEDSTRA